MVKDTIKRILENGTWLLEEFVFTSRWILAPLYVGLVIASLVYSYKFMEELIRMCQEAHRLGSEEVMLSILGMVDITMVGNLVYMVTAGGWSIFVREIDFGGYTRKPRVLNNINSGTLKVKLGMSLIGVSSVHLLKDFIGAESQDWQSLSKRLSIHGMFIISTLAMVFVERMLHAPQSDHIDVHGEHHKDPKDLHSGEKSYATKIANEFDRGHQILENQNQNGKNSHG